MAIFTFLWKKIKIGIKSEKNDDYKFTITLDYTPGPLGPGKKKLRKILYAAVDRLLGLN